MAMPKNITLINKQTKSEKPLGFKHALRLLLLDAAQGRATYNLKGEFLFDGKDIIRKPKAKKDKK